MLLIGLNKTQVKQIVLIVLLVAFSGCEAGRRFYYSATHKVVRFPTGNMQPTIQPGDYGAVNPAYYADKPVNRFDIVLLKHPQPNPILEGEDMIIVERVVGLSGERIEIRGGRVYINEKELNEPFETIKDSSESFGPINIPEGEYFFLGDNRPNSFDSRYWDRPTVNKDYLRGKVVEIFPGNG
jgi:signal peptidase I